MIKFVTGKPTQEPEAMQSIQFQGILSYKYGSRKGKQPIMNQSINARMNFDTQLQRKIIGYLIVTNEASNMDEFHLFTFQSNIEENKNVTWTQRQKMAHT